MHDTIGIFMPDSTDTIAVFIRWQVLYLGHHPEIQISSQIHLLSPGCPRPNSALTVHKSGLKHRSSIHPEIQKKAQAEIDEVVGQNQMVCISMFYYFNPT